MMLSVLFIVGLINYLTTMTEATAGDLAVLNYALVLEHLEYAFYRDGIEMLMKKNLGKVYPEFITIRDHEKTHVDVLTSVIKSLGGTPVRECVYNFGYKKAEDFVKIARVLENVGVAAYTGAAAGIDTKAILTAATTIATIEARHASFLNNLNGVSPFPAAFDSPLDMKAVIGLAGGFVVSCPDALTISPYASITLSPPSLAVGKTLAVKTSFQLSKATPSYCVFYSGSTNVNSTVTFAADNTTSCTVPAGALVGDNFVFIMNQQAYSLSANGVLGGPALVNVKAMKPTKPPRMHMG
jgi:hypothetical protein